MQAVADSEGAGGIDEVTSFSDAEKAALKYAAAMTRTPVRFDGKLLEEIRACFNQEEIVALAALAAKVNYWTRFIEAMRINPAGYTDDPLIDFDRYNTFTKPAQAQESPKEDQS